MEGKEYKVGHRLCWTASKQSHGLFVREALFMVQLAVNNPPNHLHGGNRGWDKAVWSGRRFKHQDGDAVELTYTSKDGEEVCLQLWSPCHPVLS